MIRNSSTNSLPEIKSNGHRSQSILKNDNSLLNNLMQDRHKLEMADFIKDIKQKEVNRLNIIDNAPDGMKHKI